MAHATKYRSEFDFKKHKKQGTFNKAQIDILAKDYVGAITNLTSGGRKATGSPLVIEERGLGADKFGIDNEEALIKSKSFTIGFYAASNMEFSEFFDKDDDEYRVDVNVDSSLFLRGYVISDKYSEPYHKSSNYPVSLEATDGLERLRHIPFEDSGTITGRQSYLDTILFCLNKLELELDLWENVNTYESQMVSGSSDSPLVQAFIDPESFIDDEGTAFSCYRVLSEICKEFTAELKQSDGSWHFIVKDEQKASYTRRRYNKDGAFQESATYNPIVDFAGASTSAPVIFQGFLDLLSPLKQAAVKFTAGVALNLIIDGELEANAFTDSTTLARWAKANAGMNIARIENNQNSSQFAVRLSDHGASSGDYIESEAITVPEGDGTTSNDIRIRWKYRVNTTNNTQEETAPTYEYALIATRSGTNWNYNAGTNTWTSGASPVKNTLTVKTFNVWVDEVLPTINLPNTGNSTVGSDGEAFDFKIQLYEVIDGDYTISNGIDYDRVIANILPGGALSIESVTKIASRAINKGVVADEIEILHGDVGSFSSQDFSLARFAKVTVQADQGDSGNNGDYIDLDINGLTERFTYEETSPNAADGEWNDTASFVTALQTNGVTSPNYILTENGNEITIQAAKYDDDPPGGTGSWNFNSSLGQAETDTLAIVGSEQTNNDPVSTTTGLSKGAITVQGEVTGNWFIKGDAETDPTLVSPGTPKGFTELLLERIMRGRGRTLQSLNGTVIGDIGFTSVITDTNYNSGKHFFSNGLVYDMKAGTWNGEWIEALTDDVDPVITEVTKNAEVNVNIINQDIGEGINQSILTSGFQRVKTHVDDTAIKTATTTDGPEALPAGGAGIIRAPVLFVVRLINTNVAYTGGTSLHFAIDGKKLHSIGFGITGTSGTEWIIPVNNVAWDLSSETYTDKPIKIITASGVPATGDGDLDIWTIFSEIDNN